jgi:hypothetical protein
VPISGRPPSLINRPSGCYFHPRCPYVREAHKRVDPRLTQVDGSSDHLVACLLEPATRARIWQGIQTGRDRDALVAIAAAAAEPAADRAPKVPVDQETEGVELQGAEEAQVESEPREPAPSKHVTGAWPTAGPRRPGEVAPGTEDIVE